MNPHPASSQEMGRKQAWEEGGREKWDKVGGGGDSCNMQVWGFAFAKGRMSGPASKWGQDVLTGNADRKLKGKKW